MAITASALRADVYRILDEVLETGQPVEIQRGGHRLLIVPADAPPSRLARVQPLSGLVADDPDDLVHLDWSHTWRP